MVLFAYLLHGLKNKISVKATIAEGLAVEPKKEISPFADFSDGSRDLLISELADKHRNWIAAAKNNTNSGVAGFR